MNFNLLASAFQFIFTSIVFCAGAFLTFLPWAPKVRLQLAQFFLNRFDILLPIGIIILSISLLMFVGFLMIYRRRFAQLSMQSYTVDSKLLRELLENYWKNRFPENEYAVDVILHPGPRLECIVEVPALDAEAQEVLFIEVEQELGVLLAHQLGYRKSFFLTAYESPQSLSQ
ncbi:MAG: hypothetical protein JSR58_06310 [Verrucomicrobia bacterium]|nr:hypothetical protein [Verrucomicrobiota bacterium]